MRFIFWFILLFFTVPSLAKEHSVSLNQIKHEENVWHLKMALPLLVDYSVFTLTSPNRLVVDILDSKIKPKKCAVKASIIKNCRIGRLDGNRARFVLDLKQKIYVKRSSLGKGKKEYQLNISFVIDDGSHPIEKEFVQKIKPMKGPKTHGGTRKKYILVIDAGHGGVRDIGSSDAGVDEKNLTLQYAKELRAAFAKEKNIEVRLTRTKDNFMPLQRRVFLARRRHADMLISLHSDWNSDPKVKGIAVYSLSNLSANKYARRFLESSQPRIIDGEEWQQGLPSAYDILFDIVQRDTLNKSILLSREVLRHMKGFSPVLDQPHRFADFHMLSAPDLPAVLIEMGFLSNDGDMKKLTSRKWRSNLSFRIIKAVKAYFSLLSQQEWEEDKKTNDKMLKTQYNLVAEGIGVK